jgi:TIR domain
MSNQPDSKLFISYSWSGPDHEAWVVSFAGELVSQGIHVILDKWDLQPGHDAHAFMESMVTDPTVTKVVLVCDQKYSQKSNSRSGGAGTEAQIITPELYAKKAQDKFVAVIRERDEEGRPYLPVYYGSRIYIDLTNPSTYGAEFDRLVRWAWDQPLHVRPEIGAKPRFLASGGTPGKIASAVSFRRAFDAVRNDSSNAPALVRDYFSTLAAGIGAFRVEVTSENRATLDDAIIASVDEFLPYRNEAVEMFSVITQYGCTADMLHAMHRFFEQLLRHTRRPEQVQSWSEADFDNFRFIVHELFLYALGVFLRFEMFDAFSYMLDNEYFLVDPNDSSSKMHSYLRFREYLQSFAYRNQRLQMRRLSLRADMLHERNKGTGVDFKFIMTADLILYLRSRNSDVGAMWWPETLLYVGHFGGAFEMFARAKSLRYFSRIKSLLQVNSKEELGKLLDKIGSEPDRIPRWQFESFDFYRLTGFEALATSP